MCLHLSQSLYAEGREISPRSYDHPWRGSGMSRKGKAEDDTQIQKQKDGCQGEWRCSDLRNVSTDEQALSSQGQKGTAFYRGPPMCLVLYETPESVGNIPKGSTWGSIPVDSHPVSPKTETKTRTNRCGLVGSWTEMAGKSSQKRPQHKRQKRKMQKSCFPDMSVSRFQKRMLSKTILKTASKYFRSIC